MTARKVGRGGQSVAYPLALGRAGALDRVGDEARGVVGRRGDRVGRDAVGLLVGRGESPHGRSRVLGRVVIGKVGALDRVASDLGELGRVQAVRAEDRRVQPEAAGLPGDQAGIGVVAREKEDVRLEREDRGQLRGEVGVAFGVPGLGDDAAAGRGEVVRERLRETDAVVAAGVDEEGRRGRLEVAARKSGECAALRLVGEGDAEDVVALLRDLDVRRRGRDHRNPVSLRDGRRGERARRGVLADQGDDVIAGNELRDDRSGLRRLVVIVFDAKVQADSEHASRPIDLVHRKAGAVAPGLGEGGLRPGQCAEEPDGNSLARRSLLRRRSRTGARRARRAQPTRSKGTGARGDSKRTDAALRLLERPHAS